MKTKTIFKYWASLLAAGSLATLSGSGLAAESKPETLVPEDAFAVFTIPHFPDAKEAFWSEPYVRLFQDAAMENFTKQIQSAWETFVIRGMEEQWNVRLDDYAGLLNGQITLALFLDANPTKPRPDFDVLLALDSGAKSAQLKTRLTDFRKQFSDAGWTLRAMTFPKGTFHQLRWNDESKSEGAALPLHKVVFGQAGSLFLASTKVSLIERALSNAGKDADSASLSRQPAFRRIHSRRLRQSYAYGWLNFAKLYKIIEGQVRNLDRQLAENPMIPPPSKMLQSLGLNELQSLSLHLRQLEGGSLMEFAMAVPKKDRQGLFEWIDLAEKDCSPPLRVPADVANFSRVRLNLGQLWENLEESVAELSPILGGMMNAMLRETEQGLGFNIREDIFGNLGDDLIVIGFSPRSSRLEDLISAPTLTLLGSPNPKALAQTLVKATGLIPSEENPLSKKEFQGKTIYSFAIPGLPFMEIEQPGADVGIHMAVDENYLIFSMDEQTLKNYLRPPSETHRPLRNMPGLKQATVALGPEKLTSFRYDNPAKVIGMFWELARKNPNFLAEILPSTADFDIRESPFGAEFLSALPPFEQVAKYFHFSVSGGNSDAHFINYRLFMPTPPQLRQSPALPTPDSPQTEAPAE